MVTAEEVLNDALLDTDWDKSTQISLLLAFIEDLDVTEEFTTYVEKRVDDDSDYSD